MAIAKARGRVKVTNVNALTLPFQVLRNSDIGKLDIFMVARYSRQP